MFKKSSSNVNALAVSVLLCAGFLYYIATLNSVRVLEERILSSLYRIGQKASPPITHTADEIVIVGIDDASFVNLKMRWPWGRQIFAILLEKLKTLEPKVIGIDIVFSGRSQNEEEDYWLADALKAANPVVVASYFDLDDRPVPLHGLVRESAHTYGYLNKPSDENLMIWESSPSHKKTSDRSIKSFSYAIAETYQTDSQLAPALESNRLIHYRFDAEDFAYFPVWEVIAQKIPKEHIQGKIVLIAPVAPIFHDVHLTPLGVMSGIFVNANEILTYLNRDFIYRVSPIYVQHAALLMAILLGILFFNLTFVSRAILALLYLALMYGICAIIFVSSRALISPIPFWGIGVISYTVITFHQGLKTFLENQSLQKMVVMDSLTGLYGYRYLSVRLEAEFNKYRRRTDHFYLAMVDLDFFKKVNDQYGHEAGNEVLKGFAKILKHGIRTYDVAARYGGEEFTLIIFDNNQKEVEAVLQRIRQAVEQEEFKFHNTSIKITTSIGVCSSKSPQVHSQEDLIRCADAALYEAKKAGRNQIVFYSV